MAIYEYTIPDQSTYSFFKKGSWYRGLNGDHGIMAKSTGNVEHNPAWWLGMPFTARLVSPCNWEEITNQIAIKLLEKKLQNV
jgi:hypothetical protein